MRVVIDTNVLISATTDRDPGQAARIRELFRAAAAGEVELLIPQCSLFEFVYVLSSVYSLGAHRIQTLLGDLLAMPALQVLGDFDGATWLRLWSESIRDPNDAAVAVAALATNSSVATFDRKFARRLTLLSVPLWQWEMF
jgi:predicted nucleic acid-binding protein